MDQAGYTSTRCPAGCRDLATTQRLLNYLLIFIIGSSIYNSVVLRTLFKYYVLAIGALYLYNYATTTPRRDYVYDSEGNRWNSTEEWRQHSEHKELLNIQSRRKLTLYEASHLYHIENRERILSKTTKELTRQPAYGKERFDFKPLLAPLIVPTILKSKRWYMLPPESDEKDDDDSNSDDGNDENDGNDDSNSIPYANNDDSSSTASDETNNPGNQTAANTLNSTDDPESSTGQQLPYKHFKISDVSQIHRLGPYPSVYGEGFHNMTFLILFPGGGGSGPGGEPDGGPDGGPSRIPSKRPSRRPSGGSGGRPACEPGGRPGGGPGRGSGSEHDSGPRNVSADDNGSSSDSDADGGSGGSGGVGSGSDTQTAASSAVESPEKKTPNITNNNSSTAPTSGEMSSDTTVPTGITHTTQTTAYRKLTWAEKGKDPDY